MTIESQIKQVAPNVHVHLPDGSNYQSLEEALADTTHLLIVAHADDDGLVGAQALSECYDSDDNHMTVVVVSASPGFR